MSNKCRSCLSKKKQKIFGKNVYGGIRKQHFYQCSQCHIVYLFPIIEKKKEEKFYKLNFEKFMNERSKNEIKWDDPKKHSISNSHEFKRRIKFLNINKLKNKNIMEIGSSSGFMLKPLEKYNSKLYGIEPSDNFRNYTNKNNIKTYKSIDEALKLKKKSIDLLLHYFVLEHIDDPVKFIKKSMKFLKKNGQLIFEVPNINDPLITIFKSKAFDNFYWSVVHHWYFSSITLGNLLTKNNIKHEFYFDQRYDLSNHFTWLKEGRPGGTNKYSKYFSKTLNKRYKEDLINSGYCDTLGVIIKN